MAQRNSGRAPAPNSGLIRLIILAVFLAASIGPLGVFLLIAGGAAYAFWKYRKKEEKRVCFIPRRVGKIRPKLSPRCGIPRGRRLPLTRRDGAKRPPARRFPFPGSRAVVRRSCWTCCMRESSSGTSIMIGCGS